MNFSHRLFHRIHSLFHRSAVEADMAEEMREHLEMQEAANRAAGMSADEAHYAARRQFGGVDQIKERARDQRGWVWLEDCTRDVRFGIRQLRKSPGFLAIAVLTLGLGIGANTAIFSVFYSVLLRPLPYPEQDRLVFIHEQSKEDPFDTVSYANFRAWRERQTSFTAIGLARPREFNYAAPSEAERLKGASATYDFFTAIGMPPLRGRLFTAEDDRAGAERTVILRESLWKRLFGGRESVIGERIIFSGEPHTVIGILPDKFKVPLGGAELWTPFSLSLTDNGNDLDQYGYRGDAVFAYARLKPGVSIESARSAMRVLGLQLEKEHPSGEFIPALLPLATADAGPVRPALCVLLGAAGFVLLIACANVANLQLARVRARAQEFAVRAVLGSGRRRIVRQLLIESSILGLLGCGAGLMLGYWSLDGLKAVLPAGASRVSEASLNLWVLGFTAVAGLATSLISGLVPGFQASRHDLREALAQTSRSAGSTHGSRSRAGLIVAEYALTCVLLVGAGLMLRTIGNLQRKDLGFRTEHLVTFDWMPTGGRYENPATRYNLVNRALERLAALPGVTRAGLALWLPLGGEAGGSVYCIKGRPAYEYGKEPSVEWNMVGGEFFGTLGIRLVAGRTFDAHDTWKSPRVAIVDTAFVEREFPGKNPLGERICTSGQPPGNEAAWSEIVGVVTHINSLGPVDASPPQCYFSHRQGTIDSLRFVVRTDFDPAALVPTVRAAFREVATDLAISHVQTMDQLLASNIATQRLVVTLLGIFAALALLLAGVGLFGVLSYSVGQRTREIGLRMALGATPRSVVDLVARHGLKLAGLGVLIGLAAACCLVRFLRSLLYEVSPFDPASFIAVALVLVTIGVVACWLPARRATKVNPVEALRAE